METQTAIKQSTVCHKNTTQCFRHNLLFSRHYTDKFKIKATILTVRMAKKRSVMTETDLAGSYLTVPL